MRAKVQSLTGEVRQLSLSGANADTKRITAERALADSAALSPLAPRELNGLARTGVEVAYSDASGEHGFGAWTLHEGRVLYVADECDCWTTETNQYDCEWWSSCWRHWHISPSRRLRARCVSRPPLARAPAVGRGTRRGEFLPRHVK